MSDEQPDTAKCSIRTVDGTTVRLRLDGEPTAAEYEAIDALVRAVKDKYCFACGGTGGIGGGKDVVGLAICHHCNGTGKGLG